MIGSKKLHVINRGGRMEDVHFDEITTRIKKLCYGLDMEYVDPCAITIQALNGLYAGITTAELDNLTAEIAASMGTKHPDYAVLAARIAVSNLHKETNSVFSEVISDVYNTKNMHSGKNISFISEKYFNIIQKNATTLNNAIVHERDYHYDYIGFKTLEQNYLFRIENKIVERPQCMLMRVAIGIHEEDIDRVIETYNLLSERYFIHSSVTLFTACSIKQQMSSSFLLTMSADSIEGICDTLTRCALTSKSGGGVGLNVHCIRARGTRIIGTFGVSNGLVPMLKVYNNTAEYVYQDGSKRPGSFTIYIEPWHSDIFGFLNLKKNTGKDENRARNMSYALWIPDLFMKRVLEDDFWSLMCPCKSPGLADVWGEDFEELYTDYEKSGNYNQQIKARELWSIILALQEETGSPYMLYKDHCNRKTNQQNVGTIKCSNASTEIIAYSSSDEIGTCNSASIAVNMFVDPKERKFDFEKLKMITKVVARNLDTIIDINQYPLPETKTSSLRHRPIGIGVQGLADAFILMRYPFESEEAEKLNIQIFETLYYGALEASCELAKEKGIYETYLESPVSDGILQYDMWNQNPTDLWDWDTLKKDIFKFGVRNSLLIALMPTSSTSLILGNNESIEPYKSNIYIRHVASKDYQIVNPHLLRELTKLKLWNEQMKDDIIANNGSIQNIDHIPMDIKLLYKTIWEIPQKTLLKMAAERGPFVDQSQSLSVYMAKPTTNKLTSMHFYGWKMGLKTGMYCLKTQSDINKLNSNKKEQNQCINAEKINKEVQIDKQIVDNDDNDDNDDTDDNDDNDDENDNETDSKLMCSIQNGDACFSCGS
ncbi:PREDICTED: ribonucleoside-diphosphate reductase large subunit-like [Polistes canadensis]|uniref:ribonucleoside-diphosphate reductase large subunit-like n=1 Tax=Polistes canadensis TaxID=91411 RepID=UPI000718F670|nr:PREDICTED: ribonucleoside-diphosphate reductase large subunit-like [Polistes canadensis]